MTVRGTLVKKKIFKLNSEGLIKWIGGLKILQMHPLI
jgi:hypothetical protein